MLRHLSIKDPGCDLDPMDFPGIVNDLNKAREDGTEDFEDALEEAKRGAKY